MTLIIPKRRDGMPAVSNDEWVYDEWVYDESEYDEWEYEVIYP